uniref:Uncharacterized protein n=1 Tax=viral metagenome TaxID=1070528 RepID=A0A6M3KSC9_9ZZZZ
MEGCNEQKVTWSKNEGKYTCQATQCLHFLDGGGCKLGKVSLTCDNNECSSNRKVECFGIYICSGMDVHLDANGKCLGFIKNNQI